jgi:hypothetical protein
LKVKYIKGVANTEKRPLGLRQIYLWPSLALMALATFLAGGGLFSPACWPGPSSSCPFPCLYPG